MLNVRGRSPVFYQNLWGVAFAVPAMILLFVFSVYPLVTALYTGFTKWTLREAPSEWPALFGDSLLASAGPGAPWARLAHRATVVVITGTSFRTQGRKRLEEEVIIA